MAKRIIDGIEFEMPDGEYTGKQLQKEAGVERNAVTVIRRGDKDLAIEPDEVITVGPNDRVIFTTPMEAA